MSLSTQEALVSGVCDVCKGEYESGEYIALRGEDIMCPACILEDLLLEAS